MAALARIITKVVRTSGVLVTPPLRCLNTSIIHTNWNQDWKPGPYPRTPKERLAAAKKYGLRPEDYEPYPDDGTGVGDYPKLPLVSGDSRDPYENWDAPYSKRNYGEPLQIDDDIATEERYNPNARYRYTFGQMFLWFFLVYGGIMAAFAATLEYPHFLPAMPKQFPYNELWLAKGGNPEKMPTVKHYTFEPAE